ncbi:MAG: PIN domain-containing protein [Propioniciclava sp.]|uniref:PIN domain-containing protein n=1 Tax=Propioniciclava sp. TaxID=2038686 RepID=UPI0039E711E6
MRLSRPPTATFDFLTLTTVLPFDAAAAQHAGEIRAKLTIAGQTIGGYDVLIAGHARSAGLAVVTNNTREFMRVPGLEVLDWTLGDHQPSAPGRVDEIN